MGLAAGKIQAETALFASAGRSFVRTGPAGWLSDYQADPRHNRWPEIIGLQSTKAR
jgi:hypothetical protein